MRHADLAGTDFDGASLTGAKLFGAACSAAKWGPTVADWIDTSQNGDGTKTARDKAVADFLSGKLPQQSAATRYFGKGDVLRDASLEFGEGSSVEIDSRFENCSITLAQGTDLIVGEAGVLSSCRIVGGGDVTIHGQFFERESPGIRGPRTLRVSASGALVGAIEQAPESTQFAFQPGCKLRVKILRSRNGAERSGT